MDGHAIFWVMDASVPQLKYWMPIHYDIIEDGQIKKSSFVLILSETFVIFAFAKNIISSFSLASFEYLHP